jgi:hypothetical protein
MQKRKFQYNGFATLMMVILIAFIAVLVVAATSLKILVGVERTRSFSDSLQSSYAAETEINDVIVRYLKYPSAGFIPGTTTLPDGTQLVTTSTTDIHGNTVIGILAKRPFSSFKLELTKSSVTQAAYQNLDLILTLDCTGSMNECANPAFGNSCQGTSTPNPAKPTKFESLKSGALAFIDSLQTITTANTRLGVTVFTVDSNWLTTSDGTQIKPENNVPLSTIRQTINNKFQKLVEDSAACDLVSTSSTAVGGGLKYANNNFAATKNATTKQVQVLITDGEPNSVIPDAACHEQYLSGRSVPLGFFTPQGEPSVVWEYKEVSRAQSDLHSKWQLACQLADKNTSLDAATYGQPPTNGQRDPDADAYVITIFQVTNTQVRNILNQYSSAYYDMTSATDLTNTLLTKVLPEIKSSMNNFIIKKVIP